MLEVSENNRIGVITLNRPEKRNAFNGELIQLIHEAVSKFNSSPSIRAILINANGSVFSAGADLDYLKQLRANTLEENRKDSELLADMFKEIYNSPKLTFAAVNGAAIAGGCGLSTIVDFCYATESSKFGYTEVRIGFIPALVMVFLKERISGGNLNKLLLTGELVNASQAFQYNLVSEVFAEEGFVTAVFDRIKTILESTSGQAISSTKELMRKAGQADLDKNLKLAADYNAKARSSEDCIKGMDAFLAKIKIKW